MRSDIDTNEIKIADDMLVLFSYPINPLRKMTKSLSFEKMSTIILE